LNEAKYRGFCRPPDGPTKRGRRIGFGDEVEIVDDIFARAKGQARMLDGDPAAPTESSEAMVAALPPCGASSTS